ncbi:hypothetical protein Lalb_Chr17g0344741 [Lupinus albus]|uniref:Uncharacterized protein n=1 Tax=Lupinus albus TaxID=3870 RepID=A0A6A4PAJ5_LUPAL|nr:hypothetical protein Lalb_Chr17g0344741 [Lupinus albus]
MRDPFPPRVIKKNLLHILAIYFSLALGVSISLLRPNFLKTINYTQVLLKRYILFNYSVGDFN